MSENSMGRDELFARIEVMKMAHACAADGRGADGAARDFGILWKSVVPPDRNLDCGCGNKAQQQRGFTGTHVLPFSWTRYEGSREYQMFVMDRPFLRITVHKNGRHGESDSVLILSGRDFPELAYNDTEDGLRDALQAGLNHLTAWANAHVEEVRAYLDEANRHAKA